MNLWFRVLWLLLTAPFGARLDVPFGTSRLNFRVLPNDLDTNMHMNNGRYLSVADLGRTDLLLRSGLWRSVLKHGWQPMLSGATIRFRRELRGFRAYELQTRIVWWDERIFVMEHRFVSTNKDGEPVLAAMALVRGGLYDRKRKSYVGAGEIFRELGYDGPSPAATPEVVAFLASEDAMRAA